MKLRLWGGSSHTSDAERAKLAKRIRLNGNLSIEEPIEFVEVTEEEIQAAAGKQLKRGD